MGKTEFYRTRIDPHEMPTKGLPKKKQILVKKYTKPERHGSLYLPEAHAEDTTGTLWEVVWSSDAANQFMGQKEAGFRDPREGDIITTRDSFPAEDTGCEDERDGRALFIMGAEMVYNIMLLEE